MQTYNPNQQANVTTKDVFNINYIDFLFTSKYDISAEDENEKSFFRVNIGPGITLYQNDGSSGNISGSVNGFGFNFVLGANADFRITKHSQLSLGAGLKAGILSSYTIKIGGQSATFSTNTPGYEKIPVSMFQLTAGIRFIE